MVNIMFGLYRILGVDFISLMNLYIYESKILQILQVYYYKLVGKTR